MPCIRPCFLNLVLRELHDDFVMSDFPDDAMKWCDTMHCCDELLWIAYDALMDIVAKWTEEEEEEEEEKVEEEEKEEAVF